MSLLNFNVIHAADKTPTAWGQLIYSSSYESWIAVANDRKDELRSTVIIKISSEQGLVTTTHLTVPQIATQHMNLGDILPVKEQEFEDELVWYEFELLNHFMSAYSVSRHLISGHRTGKHSF